MTRSIGRQLLRSRDWATPVILITAFGDDETHAEAMRLGAAAVFDKPVELSTLIRAVRELAPPLAERASAMAGAPTSPVR